MKPASKQLTAASEARLQVLENRIRELRSLRFARSLGICSFAAGNAAAGMAFDLALSLTGSQRNEGGESQ